MPRLLSYGTPGTISSPAFFSGSTHFAGKRHAARYRRVAIWRRHQYPTNSSNQAGKGATPKAGTAVCAPFMTMARKV
jgi:hypothetical protein